MKKRLLAVIMSLAMILTLFSATALAAEPSSGSDDFLKAVEQATSVPEGYVGIYTAEDLYNVRNNLAGNYILMSNVSLSSYSRWEPIGDDENPFTGVLDGNGYVISNFSVNINATESVNTGLFGYIDGAEIRDLGVTNSQVSVSVECSGSHYQNSYVSIIAGRAKDDGSPIFDNCYISNSNITIDAIGSVTMNAGGFAGNIESYTSVQNIVYCVNRANILVESCDATVSVGGFAGDCGALVSFAQCVNYGDVTLKSDGLKSSGASIGGILGYGGREFYQCVNYGTVKGTETVMSTNTVASASLKVGGIGGRGTASTGPAFNQCYNAGSVSGDLSISGAEIDWVTAYLYIGGICSEMSVHSIDNCYNIGEITGSVDTQANKGKTELFCLGSIVGLIEDLPANACYSISDGPDIFGYIGDIILGIDKSESIQTKNCSLLTREEMAAQDNFVGFDFDTVWTMGDSNYPYPMLRSLQPIDVPDDFEGAAPVITITPGTTISSDESAEITWKPITGAAWYHITVEDITHGIYYEKAKIVYNTSYSFLPGILSEGIYKITVQASDEHGNLSPVSNTITLTVSGENSFISKVIGNSLAYADSETKESIEAGLYNLLFNAQFRPDTNEIDDTDFGIYGSAASQRDVNAAWPAKNGERNDQIRDAVLGTLNIIGGEGCNAYGRFVSKYIYGTTGATNKKGAISSKSDFIDRIHQYADPGEWIRMDKRFGSKPSHVVVYLGESSDGNGFYYVDYSDGYTSSQVARPTIRTGYFSYDAFWSKYGATHDIYIMDTNGGSYSAGTARSLADVRVKNNVSRAILRYACPVEVTVSRNGEKLDSRTPGVASFGSVERINDQIVFDLDYYEDYQFNVVGTGEGTMTLTLQYYDTDDQIIDERVFINVPITETTEIKTGGFDAIASFVLSIDEDGDGEEDSAWGAEFGEIVTTSHPVYEQQDYGSGSFITYSISLPSQIAGGCVTVQPQAAHSSDLVTITAVPDIGYEFKKITATDVFGNNINLTEVDNGSYTFIMPASDVTIEAFFCISPPSTPSAPPSYPSDTPITYPVKMPDKSEIVGGSISVKPNRAEQGDTVTITTIPDDGYELDELIVTDSKGNELDLTDKDNGKYTFKMPAGRVEIEVSFQKIVVEPDNPFTDVYESDYYYNAVLWAVENGVTNGITATTFGPDMAVSRAQMVTFLWRAHGSPKATGTNPFTDVSTGNYYYDAVLWAVANGVTNGTSATTFSPDTAVTRSQAVTFQWRAAGSPVVSGNSFDDVATGAYYVNAVTWAVANGITNGTGGNIFSPDVVVPRAQAVTFLYRELAE